MFSQRLVAANFRFFLMRSCFFCCLREIDEAPEVWRFIPIVEGVAERFLPRRRRSRCLLLSFEFIVIKKTRWRVRGCGGCGWGGDLFCKGAACPSRQIVAQLQTPNKLFSRMTNSRSHIADTVFDPDLVQIFFTGLLPKHSTGSHVCDNLIDSHRKPKMYGNLRSVNEPTSYRSVRKSVQGSLDHCTKCMTQGIARQSRGNFAILARWR